MERPQRWSTPFGLDVSDDDIEMLLKRSDIAAIEADRFPAHTSLEGVLRNDARLVKYRQGDLVVREGDYGNSAFLVLEGNLRVVLAPKLPNDMLGRHQTRKKVFF